MWSSCCGIFCSYNDYCSFFLQTQPELETLRQSHIQARKDGVAENVATVLLRYEGAGTDDEILKALDNKYDTLKDKLLLEAMKKQLGMF